MINPYVIIGGLLLLIATAFGGEHVGRTMERTVWLTAAKKAADAAQVEQNRLIAKNESDRQAYIQDAKIASDYHEKEIADINRQHAIDIKRVRVTGPFLHTVTTPGQSASPGNAGQAATTAEFLPDAFVSNLRQLAADADTAVADLRQLETDAKTAGCFEGYP